MIIGLVIVLFLISNSSAFPAQESGSQSDGKTLFQDVTNSIPFSTENITIKYGLKEEFGLNITAVSPVNNPDEFLLLFNNLTNNISISNIGNFSIYVFSEDKITPYGNANYSYMTGLDLHGVYYDGAVVVNSSTYIFKSLKTEVDFTDFKKRSRIEYNVTIQLEVNLTWVTDSSIFKENTPHLLSKSNVDPNPPNFTALVPLVNGTFYDEALCQNEKCIANLKKSFNIDSFYVLDDITVTNERIIDTPTIASKRLVIGTNTTYSVVYTTNVYNLIDIGEHRC